jgi:hypothetical protein
MLMTKVNRLLPFSHFALSLTTEDDRSHYYSKRRVVDLVQKQSFKTGSISIELPPLFQYPISADQDYSSVLEQGGDTRFHFQEEDWLPIELCIMTYSIHNLIYLSMELNVNLESMKNCFELAASVSYLIFSPAHRMPGGLV